MTKKSTTVDKQRRGWTPAPETRARILEAARLAWCRAGFDQVGVRELAAAADVDPAIVIRLFGSKDALFAEVAAGAFGFEAPFVGGRAGLGARVAAHLTGKIAPEPGFDELAFLVRSAASPVAAPILSAALHAGFVGPLAAMLGGKRDAAAQAALVTAIVLGFSTLRVSLGSQALASVSRARLAAGLAAAIDACLA